jgi:hypothetical protein
MSLEDTGEIKASRRRRDHIDKLLDQRAHAVPPRWMTNLTWGVGIAALFDVALFSAHAVDSRHRDGMGVALGVHVAIFAVLCLIATYMAVGVARIRLDITRAAEQDEIDAYRHDRMIGEIRDAIAEQPDIIRDAVKDVLADRDRAERQDYWLGRAAQTRDDFNLPPDGANDGNSTTVIRLPHTRTPRRSG